MKTILFFLFFIVVISNIEAQDVLNDASNQFGKYKTLIKQVKLSGKTFKDFKKQLDGKTDIGKHEAIKVDTCEIPEGYWVYNKEAMPKVGQATSNGVQMKIGLGDIWQAGKALVKSPTLFVWSEEVPEDQRPKPVVSENNTASGNTQQTNLHKSTGNKTFTDARDGSNYTYNKFGDQYWMTTSLKYQSEDQVYLNDLSGVCPSGWNMPTLEDYISLWQNFYEQGKTIDDIIPLFTDAKQGEQYQTQGMPFLTTTIENTSQIIFSIDRMNKEKGYSTKGSYMPSKEEIRKLLSYNIRCYTLNDPSPISESNLAKPISVSQESFKDSRDGTNYSAAKFENLYWMTQNLDFNSSRSFKLPNTSGRFYTWLSAQDACPTGWHIPTNDEWLGLEKFLQIPDRELKQYGKNSPDRGRKQITNLMSPNAFNTSLDGFYYQSANNNKDERAFYWTSTKSSNNSNYLREIKNENVLITEGSIKEATTGYSIRCVTNSFKSVTDKSDKSNYDMLSERGIPPVVPSEDNEPIKIDGFKPINLPSGIKSFSVNIDQKHPDHGQMLSKAAFIPLFGEIRETGKQMLDTRNEYVFSDKEKEWTEKFLNIPKLEKVENNGDISITLALDYCHIMSKKEDKDKRGFYKIIYKFPAKLIIKNRDGSVILEQVLNDDNLGYHLNWDETANQVVVLHDYPSEGMLASVHGIKPILRKAAYILTNLK